MIHNMRTQKFNEPEKAILKIIGAHFKTNVDNLKILDIEFDKEQNRFDILLSRPGLLIGKLGRDIDQILKIANEELKVSQLVDHEFTFNLHEATIDRYLHMWNYTNEYMRKEEL